MGLPTNNQPDEENRSRVEYLQMEIGRLLRRNETILFELSAARRKIAGIDQALFGAGSQELREHTPLHLISMLADLCRPERAADGVSRAPDWTGACIGYRVAEGNERSVTTSRPGPDRGNELGQAAGRTLNSKSSRQRNRA